MPARKLKKRKRSIGLKCKKNKKGKYFYLSLILFTLFSFTAFKLLKTDRWDGNSLFRFTTYNSKDQQVNIFVINPSEVEFVKISIPGDTVVDVARSYGNIKLRNVWQLAENEKLGGILLAETITRYFYLPVSNYAEYSNDEFTGNGLTSFFRIVFSDYDTNLNIADRFALSLFLVKVRNIDRIEYDLKDTSYLEEKVLNDGSNGFEYTGYTSVEIQSYFNDNNLTRKNTRLKILNKSGNSQLVKRVSPVIESLGTKVSFYQNEDEEDIDCIVYAEKSMAKSFVEIFNCKLEKGSEDSNYDIILKLGKKFDKRY